MSTGPSKSDSFVHLHVHTEYSMLDGAARLKDLFAEAGRMGMPALAMTDHGNIFGDPDKVQFKAISAANRIPFLKSGSVDLVARAMTVTCDRWKDVYFSGVYFTSSLRLLVRTPWENPGAPRGSAPSAGVVDNPSGHHRQVPAGTRGQP